MDSEAPTSKRWKRLKQGLSNLNSTSLSSAKKIVCWGQEEVLDTLRERSCPGQEVTRVTWTRPSTSKTEELPPTPLVWTDIQRSKRAQDWKEVQDPLEMFYYPRNSDTLTIMDTDALPRGPQAVHSLMKEALRTSVPPRHWTSREVRDGRFLPLRCRCLFWGGQSGVREERDLLMWQ